MEIQIQTPRLDIEKALYVIAAIVGLIFIVKLIKQISYKIGSEIPDYVPSTGMNLTYNRDTYKTMANQLYNAMNGCFTDESTIYDVLKRLKTKDDWIYLKRIFGKRKATKRCLFDSFKGGTLEEWLYEDLDRGERRKVNEILSRIGVSI